VKTDSVRVVSGSLLTGTNISERQFLGFYDTSICVVPEGDKYEMFGWALPGLNKLSASPTFLSKLIPGKKFIVDTNFHGGERAYVVTGEYEKVCPIDIYPQILIKAIMAEDIDKMEQLGIYEVIEEDLALCEFVCTSKIEVQHILRTGLELIRKEMS
jgi:Na+-transporting NADH:ubiquinone oxidoreductase subunit A